MSDIIALKDLCEIDITDGTHKTPTYSESGYIFLSSKNVTTGEIDWDNVMYIPDWLHNELYRRISPQKDDILLAKNGTTGVAAIVDRDEIFDIYVSLALIRPKKTKILPRYLLHAINSEPSKRYFDGHLKGIGVPNLHLTHIRETPIKVPNFEKQISVVNELDKVTNLINKRKEQLEKLDELVKARFVELFGDYRINEKGFDCNKGSELFKFSSGKFLPEEKRLDKGIPVYGGNGIAWYTNECLIDYPTIIIGRVGAQCGNIHAVTTPVWITDNAIYIKEQKTKAYTLEFLTELMKMMDFYQYADFSGQPKITQKPLETLEYIMPPIELQNEYTAFVKQTDKSKLEVQKSLEKLELLKKALMQKYFG